MQWAAADFGFRVCPIFRLDILKADKEGVLLGPLRCYYKETDNFTFLATSKRPTKLHPNGVKPSMLLPVRKTVSWIFWRTKKCHSVGMDVSQFQLREAPEMAQNRKVFVLSARNREKRIQEIQESQNAEEWRGLG